MSADTIAVAAAGVLLASAVALILTGIRTGRAAERMPTGSLARIDAHRRASHYGLAGAAVAFTASFVAQLAWLS